MRYGVDRTCGTRYGLPEWKRVWRFAVRAFAKGVYKSPGEVCANPCAWGAAIRILAMGDWVGEALGQAP
jgi:hypothetical protein